MVNAEQVATYVLWDDETGSQRRVEAPRSDSRPFLRLLTRLNLWKAL